MDLGCVTLLLWSEPLRYEFGAEACVDGRHNVTFSVGRRGRGPCPLLATAFSPAGRGSNIWSVTISTSLFWLGVSNTFNLFAFPVPRERPKGRGSTTTSTRLPGSAATIFGNRRGSALAARHISCEPKELSERVWKMVCWKRRGPAPDSESGAGRPRHPFAKQALRERPRAGMVFGPANPIRFGVSQPG